ncbi:conserved hypothetical protein [Acidimicrobium ferrooxidans DSM 10331]|uniref:Uncharacterized protein n=2 Tax=Acidimicrobium ferrooxidans TaxID=53635 RepID=C7M2L3_ACIFD|nr:conserved hypothetical protein [Acidimicrobium ferrooxidans DSM 10331]
MAEWLEDHLAILFVVAVGIGVGVGRLGGGGAVAIGPTLALLVAASAVTVGAGSGVRSGSRWRLVLVVVVAQAGIVVVTELVAAIESGPLRDAVLCLGVAPSEIATIGLAALVGREAARAAAVLVAGSAILSVVVAGPVLGLLAVSGHVASNGVLVALALEVALPGAIGMGVARLVRRPWVRGTGRLVSPLALLALGVEVGTLAPIAIADVAAIGSFALVIVGSAAVALAMAMLVGTTARAGVVLAVGVRDFAVASGIAEAAIGAHAAGVLALYGLLGVGVAAGAERWWRSRGARS